LSDEIRDIRKEKSVTKAGYNMLFIIDNDFSNLNKLLK